VREPVDLRDMVRTSERRTRGMSRERGLGRNTPAPVSVDRAAGAEGIQCGYRYGELYVLPRPVGVKDMVAMLGAWEVPPPFSSYASG